MTYIKIGDTLYPARISGNLYDSDWNKRASKSITLEMGYATALTLFVDGLVWSIVTEQTVKTLRVGEDGEPILDDYLQPIYDEVVTTEEFDNSDYCVAGSITDNRNGTVTAKMGKITDSEVLAELLEVLA